MGAMHRMSIYSRSLVDPHLSEVSCLDLDIAHRVTYCTLITNLNNFKQGRQKRKHCALPRCIMGGKGISENYASQVCTLMKTRKFLDITHSSYLGYGRFILSSKILIDA